MRRDQVRVVRQDELRLRVRLLRLVEAQRGEEDGRDWRAAGLWGRGQERPLLELGESVVVHNSDTLVHGQQLYSH